MHIDTKSIKIFFFFNLARQSFKNFVNWLRLYEVAVTFKNMDTALTCQNIHEMNNKWLYQNDAKTTRE